MKTAGIIAEYNPFHNGHLYQLDLLKKSGFDRTVVALSGNFVQRGEPAVTDKWARTLMALKGGADLVVEIPTCYCLAPAEKYAYGAVSVLNSLGVVDSLCFGSEKGDIDILNKFVYDIKDDEGVKLKLKENLKEGLGYASAFEKAVETVFSKDYSEILKNPNDILGIEYISALKKLGSDIKPFPISRKGVLHNDEKICGDIASASKIRDMIFLGEDFLPFVPSGTGEVYLESVKKGEAPVRLKQGERAVLGALRALKASDFSKLSDVTEGLDLRIFNSVEKAGDLDTLFELIRTKRYTDSRIKRLILNAVLGIFEYKNPPYIRVLGFSKEGNTLLKSIKEKSDFPIVTSYSDAKKLGKECEEFFLKEAEYTDFYSMLMTKIPPKGREFSKSVVKI